MEIKKDIELMRKRNKAPLLIVWITWKLFVTMIMIQKCSWPEDLSIRKGNDIQVPWGYLQCDPDGVSVRWVEVREEDLRGTWWSEMNDELNE